MIAAEEVVETRNIAGALVGEGMEEDSAEVRPSSDLGSES